MRRLIAGICGLGASLVWLMFIVASDAPSWRIALGLGGVGLMLAAAIWELRLYLRDQS